MEEENEDLFERKDLRKKKEKKRTHKQTNSKHEKDDYAKESFKKMRDELEELRKKEADRAKEFDELKKKIEEREKGQTNSDNRTDYALGFDKDLYLNKGFIESAKWIKDVVAKNMSEKMSAVNNKTRFDALLTSKKKSCYLGVRACARFNRGELCLNGKWHTSHRPDGLWTRHGPMVRQEVEPTGADYHGRADHRVEQQGRKNELRLHACTLCIEALGAAYGHTVLECPWILKKNWIE